MSATVALEDASWAGEHLVLCADRKLGARAVIAVDDTTRGPALGGVRFAPYPSTRAAVRECIRLAEAMTLKNAAADLPYGGAKSVIVRNGPVDRRALMRFFARRVALLGGAYIPGVDVGTTVEDLALMAGIAPDVACHTEDPSPWTALGVMAGMRAAIDHRWEADFSDISVVVQGAGHVGAELTRLLVEAGADVRVADVDQSRAQAMSRAYGVKLVAADQALFERCDIFAPCALARVITPGNVDRLGCQIVAGAANDTLASEDVAKGLATRGILYVPDFVLNAGGVIQIHGLRQGWSDDRLRRDVLEIGDRVKRVLVAAAAEGICPADAAAAAAYASLGRKPLSRLPAA